MKLAKLINGTIDLIEIENGIEICDKVKKRRENQLYKEGYKKACENPNGGEWIEYQTCWVQENIATPEEEIGG